MTVERFERICKKLYGQGKLFWDKYGYWKTWCYILPNGDFVPYGVVYSDDDTHSLVFVPGDRFVGSEDTVVIFKEAKDGQVFIKRSAKHFSLSMREMNDCYVIRERKGKLYFTRI